MIPRHSSASRRVRAAGLLFARLSAQTVAPASGETVTLPTFSVSTTLDKGYRAGNSVSATRIDTPIKDLPFTISAFTDQFISDLGARAA